MRNDQTTDANAGPGRSTDDEDQPLDPAAELLRIKLTRLLIGSFGIMGLGFVAVFIAILYRTGVIGGADGEMLQTTPSVEASGVIALQPGEQVMASDLDGARILLRVRGRDGGEAMILFDSATGQTIGRYDLQQQPPQSQ